MTTTKETPTTNTVASLTEIVGPNFGTNKYSALMSEVYKDAQVIFGLDPIQSEKLARRVGSDYGALNVGGNVTLKDITFGKPNKDSKLSIKEAVGKLKGVTLSNSLLALIALKYANECSLHGFSFRGNIKWVVGEKLTEFFIEL